MQGVNQVRQLYVVSKLVSQVPSSLGEGRFIPVKSNNGTAFGVRLQHFGHAGLSAGDIIKAGKVRNIVLTPYSKLQKHLKSTVLELDSSVNSGAPIAGQDYIVDIVVSNYISLSDESVLVKFGAVHATTGMTASNFYVALAKSFVRNFSRDVNKFFKFYVATDVDDDSTYEEVTMSSKHEDTYAGIIIEEQSQEKEWVLGECPLRTVNFKVYPKSVVLDGSEVQPFKINAEGFTDLADNGTTIASGYGVADLEWFCMGERGDQIRQMGYPRTIRTKYMVDPTKDYNVLDITFWDEGKANNVNKSEKQITLVFEKTAVSSEALAALIAQLTNSVKFDCSEQLSALDTKVGAVDTKAKSVSDRLEDVLTDISAATPADATELVAAISTAAEAHTDDYQEAEAEGEGE